MQVLSRQKPACVDVLFSIVCLRARVREGYRIKLLGTRSALLAHSTRIQTMSTTCPQVSENGKIIDYLSFKKPSGCNSYECVEPQLILLAGDGINGFSCPVS